ncbi:hypothetical protein B0H16DRAFT_1466620 [Mycena metata]|uniref:Uncharacterized protein n=1 Tax=Mycena metata TaxID=1033252 RepID=A0AAD7I6X6_9AGAR|nr:hypothetical protein B0H16DRAFT_1466620 [Mycena metata]
MRAKVHRRDVPELIASDVSLAGRSASGRTPLLSPPPVSARDIKSTPGVPVILGASVALTFEYHSGTRGFGRSTVEDDATAIVDFLRPFGGARHLSYVRYLITVFREVSNGLRPDGPRENPPALLWTRIGVVLKYVHAVLKFLKGQAEVPHFCYTSYIWLVLELVPIMLASA